MLICIYSEQKVVSSSFRVLWFHGSNHSRHCERMCEDLLLPSGYACGTLLATDVHLPRGVTPVPARFGAPTPAQPHVPDSICDIAAT
jgi:hypothetical protein